MSSGPESIKKSVQRSLRRRYRREQRFRIMGLAAVLIGLIFLVFFFTTIIGNGYTAFAQTHVRLDIDVPAAPAEGWDAAAIQALDYRQLVRDALLRLFPEVGERTERRELNRLISPGASYLLRDKLVDDPSLLEGSLSVWLPADDEVDMLVKGHNSREAPESQRRVSDRQLQFIDRLVAADRLERRFNVLFFTSGDSRDPELAGIWGAAVGSFYMLRSRYYCHSRWALPPPFICRSLRPATAGRI